MDEPQMKTMLAGPTDPGYFAAVRRSSSLVRVEGRHNWFMKAWIYLQMNSVGHRIASPFPIASLCWSTDVPLTPSVLVCALCAWESHSPILLPLPTCARCSAAALSLLAR